MFVRRFTTAAIAFFALTAYSGAANSTGPKPESQPLQCEAGPLKKTFGKTPWLVYGCADGRSLVAVSAPGNPAMPFYFMLYPNKNGLTIVGEGTGQKEASAQAYAELSVFTEAQVRAVFDEIKASGK